MNLASTRRLARRVRKALAGSGKRTDLLRIHERQETRLRKEGSSAAQGHSAELPGARIEDLYRDAPRMESA